MDVGVGFTDRAAFVDAVGFSHDLWVLHISICITPENVLRIKEQETRLILHERDDDK